MSSVEIITKKTEDLLDVATEFWKNFPGCSQYLLPTDNLRRKLQKPCVLAVGGKVKAGKSSFINALLGKKLAKVGELETTATINMFRHISEAGGGYTEERPVKVVWESGNETWETSSFMDSLQGNDEATLRRAEGISHLEFFEDNDLLKALTLVDTPGTDAVVGENGMAHQHVADRFFNLRQKHADQTESSMAGADAIIYLVGAVAGAQGKKFLEDFRLVASDASAINAMGVLAKVDIDEDLLQKRQRQAESVADSLRDSLYKVIPVSAGMHEAIKQHEHRFPALQVWLKHMPHRAFEHFMSIDSEYGYLTDNKTRLDDIYKGSTETPPSVAERIQMKGDLQWSLFRTIARILYESDNCEDALCQMHDIANIDAVRKTIDECFFNRSKIIRCNSVLGALHNLTLDAQRTSFASMRSNRDDLNNWMKIVRIGEQAGYRDEAEGLRRFITNNLPSLEDVDKMEREFVSTLIIPIEDLQQELVDVDSNFRNLATLQSRREFWPENDYDELCTVFGLYGKFEFPEGFDFYERQAYWQMKSSRLRDKRDRAVAEFAVESYGKLMSHH